MNSRIWSLSSRVRWLSIVVMAAGAIAAATPRAAFALASCATTIPACGCQVDTAAVYETSGPLTSASASTDCIDITAAGSVLVLAGNITGPGGGVTADGIHVMSGASNAFISGKTTPTFSGPHAAIGGFATGIQVDASNVEIDLLDATGNVTNGVVFNGVSGGDYDDATADSNTGGAGVLIMGGSQNIVADDTINSNTNGVEFSNTAMDRIVDTEADTNAVYGYWFNQTNDSHVKDSGASKSGGTGTYLGCASTGGPTGKKCPSGSQPSNFNHVIFSGGNSNGGASVAIDAGDSSNVVDGDAGSSNALSDATDDNKKCDHNVWFEDSFTKVSQSCIH